MFNMSGTKLEAWADRDLAYLSALCVTFGENWKTRESEENKMQTCRVLMVTSGCTVTDVKHAGVGGGGFLQYNSYTTPTSSLSLALPVNKHTQVGHQNLPNDNLLLLFSTTPWRLQTHLCSGRQKTLFLCEGTIQLPNYVKNLQNVSHRSALGGENVNPPCSATTTQ